MTGTDRRAVLEAILAAKREAIDALKAAPPPPPGRTAPLDVVAALQRPPGAPLRLVTEVKFRSPSAGALSRALGVGPRALAYAAAGAAMVSVLCDAPYFDGAFEHLALAREALEGSGRAVPVLAKEFVLDAIQLRVARANGADAVLLIARILEGRVLAELIDAARGVGLEPLVEIASDDELDRALGTPARLIGVNARDLDTLRIDAPRAARLVGNIPADRVALHLSGLSTEEDIREVARGRADAALLGEALMRQDDPSPLLARLVRAAAG